MKKKISLKSFLVKKLRSMALRWPARNEVFKRIRTDRGKYNCESCGQTFKREGIHVDHIDPVVDIKLGFVDWNSYIERLFCDELGLQGLCVPCHEAKTMQEDQMREYYKIERKKEAARLKLQDLRERGE